MTKPTVSAYKPKLKKLIKRAIRKGNFALTSGKKSSFYIDGRYFTLSPEGAYYSALAVADFAAKNKFDAVGGPTLGADPIIGALAYHSYIKRKPFALFIVRKKPKKHALMRQIEGPPIKKKSRILLIDDTSTTGESLLESLQALKKEGYKVSDAFVLVEREEGARENLKKEGVTLHRLFILKELL